MWSAGHLWLVHRQTYYNLSAQGNLRVNTLVVDHEK